MNNYEFLGYKPYPEDPYVNASCKIRIDKRYVVVFLHKKKKDGSMFWAPVSAGVTDAGEKHYLNGFEDKLTEPEELQDFIRDGVKRAIEMKLVHQAQQAAPASGTYYPHGMAQNTPPPTSMSEVAANDNLPF